MPTAWPELYDLQSLLISMGFSETIVADDGTSTTTCSFGDGIVRNSILSEAVGILEQECGCKPLLAIETETLLKHDPPGAKGAYYGAPMGGGRILKLKQPCTSIVSFTVGGNTYTEDEDFFTVKTTDQLAIIAVEFMAPVYGSPRSVSVTANWGRFATVPDDAWSACLRLAGALCIQEAREGMKAQPVRWQEGDVSESYGELMLKEAGDGIREKALDTIRRYALLGSWL